MLRDLPDNHLMALLQPQALHPEHHPHQHPGQRVSEGDLGRHFFADYGFSQRLVGGVTVSRRCNARKGSFVGSTLMVRSGVRSLKVVWLANTCWVSVTLPDRVNIRAA